MKLVLLFLYLSGGMIKSISMLSSRKQIHRKPSRKQHVVKTSQENSDDSQLECYDTNTRQGVPQVVWIVSFLWMASISDFLDNIRGCHVNMCKLRQDLQNSSALSECNIGLKTSTKTLIPDDPDMSNECKHVSRNDITYLAFDSSPLDATYDAMRRFYIWMMHWTFNHQTSWIRAVRHIWQTRRGVCACSSCGVLVVEQNILQYNGQYVLQYEMHYAMEWQNNLHKADAKQTPYESNG
jgi:hypothetical protein